jgi:predicted RecB family nuclease
MKRPLTERILNSSFDCKTKCYLLLQGRHGTKTEYETHADDFDREYQREAIVRLQDFDPDNETLHLKNLPSSTPHNSSLMVIKRGEVDGLQSDAIVLSRQSRGEALTPMFFHRYEDISTRAKLLLAFRAIMVGKATGIIPTHGKVIYGREFAHSTIPLTTFIAKTENIIHSIRELSNQKSTPFFLCSHCEICEFRTTCRSRAIEEDNISLLEGIGRSQIEEQHRRGIFTLHQYSHTFRSRRTPKRAKNPTNPRYFALQARALRDKKIYIHGKAELPITAPSIFFDFEGIPGRRFYYLFGMLIVTDTVSYRSFWANDESEQGGAFMKFCEALAPYPDAAFFHYGNYELKVLKEMKGCVDGHYDAVIDRILGSSHNILSLIHQHCYFPTYSNRLKEVAGFLGYRFHNAINSGLGSVLFRGAGKTPQMNHLKMNLSDTTDRIARRLEGYMFF